MTIDDLDRALSITPRGDSTFVTTVPDGWQQGRGAFGGLVLGMLARAMEQTARDSARTLRSLSGEIIAPLLAEPAEIRVELLRKGNSLTSTAARLSQGRELRAQATAIFAKPRITDREHLGIEPPAPIAWQEIEPAPLGDVGPPFARAFEYRSARGFFDTGELVTDGFIRTKKPLVALAASELIAYIDAWWPTAFGRESMPRPMATIAFSFQLFLDPRTLSPTEPLRFRARALAAHEGYLVEQRELWTLDGRLVALNPQLFVYIR